MPGLVIRNLPDDLHRRLKEQAARHHRSMTREVLAVLERALNQDSPETELPPPFRAKLRLTDEQIAKGRREGRE